MGLLSSLLPPRPELQLYGKLPIAKDYLRIGCGGGSALAFREWLDRAFSTDVGGSRGPTLPWPMHFLVGTEGRDVLVGTLWNSADAGGERAFPFTLFVRRSRGAARKDLESSLVEGVSLWEELERVRERIDDYREGRELLRGERGRLVRGRSRGGDASPVSLEDWLAALWPERGLDGVREAVEELAAEVAAGNLHARRLPLAPRRSVVEQARAWLLLLERAGSRARSGVPTLFVPQLWPGELRGEASEEPRWMTVHLSPLRPTDVELLSRGEASPAHSTLDLESHPAPPTAACAVEKALVESLRDALDR